MADLPSPQRFTVGRFHNAPKHMEIVGRIVILVLGMPGLEFHFIWKIDFGADLESLPTPTGQTKALPKKKVRLCKGDWMM